jgi:hypothetical protein
MRLTVQVKVPGWAPEAEQIEARPYLPNGKANYQAARYFAATTPMQLTVSYKRSKTQMPTLFGSAPSTGVVGLPFLNSLLE